MPTIAIRAPRGINAREAKHMLVKSLEKNSEAQEIIQETWKTLFIGESTSHRIHLSPLELGRLNRLVDASESDIDRHWAATRLIFAAERSRKANSK